MQLGSTREDVEALVDEMVACQLWRTGSTPDSPGADRAAMLLENAEFNEDGLLTNWCARLGLTMCRLLLWVQGLVGGGLAVRSLRPHLCQAHISAGELQQPACGGLPVSATDPLAVHAKW